MSAGHNSAEIGVDFDFLVSILNELGEKKKSVSEANGKLRARLKEVEKEEGWHPKAVAMIRALDAMSPTERQDVLRTFRPMYDAMEEHAWGPEGQDLLANLEEDAD